MALTTPDSPESLLALVEREGLPRAVTLLRKPPVSSLLLQELCALGAERPQARLFVAAYPLSPGHLLEELAQGEGSAEASLAVLLAGNPRTPPHILSQLAKHEAVEVRCAVARHQRLPARELGVLSQDASPEVRAALAAAGPLRLPDIALLCDDEEAMVRLALASHSALSPQAALVLGADSSATVRLQTVASAKVEEELLVAWAACDEEDVQLALLRRSSLPRRALRLLHLSPHPSVRARTFEREVPDEVALYHLCARGLPEERLRVASLPGLSPTLQSHLASTGDEAVLTALAGNASLNGNVAAYLAGNGSESVCEALVCNAALSASLLEELAATRFPGVLRALAYRRDLPSGLVTALLQLSPEFRRHRACSGLGVGPLDEETARILWQDTLPRVRALAVRCHDWRRAELYDLARDPVPLVRLEAVRHPKAPEGLLSDWTRDPDPEVAAAAAVALKTLLSQKGVPPPKAPERVVAVASPIPVGIVDDFAPPPEPAEAPPSGLPSTVEPGADPGLISKLKRFFFR